MYKKRKTPLRVPRNICVYFKVNTLFTHPKPPLMRIKPAAVGSCKALSMDCVPYIRNKMGKSALHFRLCSCFNAKFHFLSNRMSLLPDKLWNGFNKYNGENNLLVPPQQPSTKCLIFLILPPCAMCLQGVDQYPIISLRILLPLLFTILYRDDDLQLNVYKGSSPKKCQNLFIF